REVIPSRRLASQVAIRGEPVGILATGSSARMSCKDAPMPEQREATVTTVDRTQGELAREGAANPLWYHTMELEPGLVTPGWFDLRPIVDRLPWPSLAGKRCLDIGTYDGFLAFEMERRGATEVVATDVPEHENWDWPPLLRARGPEALAAIAGPKKGLG